MGTILNAEERKDLLVRHRGERDGRIRDRIKAVLLRDDGMSYGEIARVLFLSDEGVRQQIEDYLRQNGKLQPENGGSEARLNRNGPGWCLGGNIPFRGAAGGSRIWQASAPRARLPEGRKNAGLLWR
jgi:uncharacterized protein YeeX (DUF496 family)